MRLPRPVAVRSAPSWPSRRDREHRRRPPRARAATARGPSRAGPSGRRRAWACAAARSSAARRRPSGSAPPASRCVRNGKLAGEWNWRLAARRAARGLLDHQVRHQHARRHRVRDGDLRLDDRVSRYVPQWRGTASEAVTVRNLLSNDSGRFWSLQSDYTDLLRRGAARRTPSGCRSSTPPAAPGPTTTPRSRCSSRCWRRRPGCRVARFARERLFEPLGMTHSTLHHRPRRRRRGVLRPADHVPRPGPLRLALPRPGQGRRRAGCSTRATSSARSAGRPPSHNAAYGYLWWLNRPGLLRGATDPVDAQGQPLEQVTGQLAPYAPGGPVRRARLRRPGAAGRPDDADHGGPARRPRPAGRGGLRVRQRRDRADRVAALSARSDYQPRSDSRCGCGISSTLMPTIASPSPRETLATTSGSS